MPDRSTPQFGSLLKRHRLAAGLSQAELAERAGLSPDGIGALESGRRATPRLYTVRALADALSLAEDERLRLLAAAQAAPGPAAGPAPATAPPRAEPRVTTGAWGRLAAPPCPPTRLIGREREVAEIAFALRSGQTRLLTLTGPGGVGKTRLAIAAAEAIAEAFPDGVAWVELGHIVGPADDATPLVAGAIARALGTQEPAPRAMAASLAQAIGTRKAALVLDNFEHLLGASPLIAAVLAACPELVMLVTSRECLHLRGEREVVVQPLAVPDLEGAAGYDATGVSNVAAVRLFVLRAGEVRGDFALTAANAPVVARLCRQLDGLPLAIELAARWVKLLPPEALAERISPRLPLLAGGGGDLPDRQQTMRDTIAWSYALLQPDEQRLFRRLGVFAGGFTLEAVEAIGGDDCSPDTLALVAALVDKSLVQPMPPVTSETAPRFGMLETIREFALERLAASGEEVAIRAAHARYCTHLVETLRRAAGAQKGALDQLQAEHANVRATLEWLDAKGPVVDFVHLAALLPGFWSRGGHLREARIWLKRAVAKAEVAAADDRARVQIGLGLVLTWQGELETAEPLFAAGIPLLRTSGHTLDTATALNWYGSLAIFRGDHARAEVILNDALGCAKAAGDEPGAVNCTASALDNLGLAALGRGDFDLAETRLAEALRLRDAHGFDLAAAVSVEGLAAVAYTRGDYQLALQRYRESLTRFGDRGELNHVASALAGVACSAAALGHAGAAARLFGAVQAVLERAGMRAFEPVWQANVDGHRAAVQGILGDEAFASTWAEGHNRSWSELMEEVATLSEPALAATPTMPAPALAAKRKRRSGISRSVSRSPISWSTVRARGLSRSAGDPADRQQTMRNTIAWSYELLRPEEQRLFRRLGVFAGGFTLEAAQWVANDERGDAGSPGDSTPGARSPTPETLALVAALVDKSLVRPMAPLTSGTPPRFGMMQSIREFALERLAASGETEATRVTHAAYFVALVETVIATPGGEGVEWLECLAPEVPNLRGAIAHAVEHGEAEAAFRMAEAWQLLSWSSRADSGEALRWLEAALTLDGGAEARVHALIAASGLAALRGDHPRAIALAEEGLAVSLARDYSFGVAYALFYLGVAVEWSGDLEGAAGRYTEAIVRWRVLGETYWLALTQTNLGIVTLWRGDAVGASALVAEGLAGSRAVNDAWGTALALGALAAVACDRGDLPRAAALNAESLALWSAMGDQRGAAGALAGMAGVAVAKGDYRQAARLLGAAAALAETVQAAHVVHDEQYKRVLTATRAGLDAATFAEAWATGRALPPEGIAALAEVTPTQN